MRIAIWILVIVVAIVLTGWIGLRIKPAPFAPVTLPPLSPGTMPLPADLPAPVAGFYRQVYGDTVPVVETAIISGRATMRIMGITFPARYRFILRHRSARPLGAGGRRDCAALCALRRRGRAVCGAL